VRIVLISLHFAEYATRLALELSRLHAVQLHLSESNASAELTPQILAQLHCAVELHLHPRVTRRQSIIQGFRLARRVRSYCPDIVHAQEAGDWALAVARVLTRDIPFVYTVHDPRPHSGNDQFVAARNRRPRTYLRSSADAIIVHGNSIVSDMQAATPMARNKISVVLHGLLGEPLSPTDALGDGFVFFGRIEGYKGLDILLDALDLLASQCEAVKLHIVGRGPELERERARIAANPAIILTEKFIPAADVPAVLRKGRAVILPYRDATQSGVVANAFAAGVPVIASDVGALTDILDSETNAIVVPPGDALSLARAILRVERDDGLARRLAVGASATAISKLAWTVIARETVTVYERAVRNANPGKAGC
jgi:glycosyltransferase involved in cell wall biosynthesis